MAQRGIAVISTENSILEFSADSGATWREVPGIVDYVESGSEIPTRDVVPLSNRVQKRAGRPRVPSIACSGFHLPQSDVLSTLRTAKNNRTTLTWRFTTEKIDLFNGGTGSTGAMAAIATTGIVTITAGSGVGAVAVPDFTNEQYGVGMAFRIGSNLYIVDSFNTAGNAVVAPVPSSAVSAAAFVIEVPAVRRGPFQGFVTNVDEWNAASEAEVQHVLMIQPLATLPAAVAVV